MPSARPRRRSAGGARLVVTVTAPDGGPAIARGLSAWLGKVAPATARGEVTVAIISDGRMRTLNRSFRNKNYATDVLSFPVADGGEKAFSPAGAEKTLGDIVIASGVAERQADAAGHSLATELKVLALHGLLHLLGYDHETDSGEMARVEARLRRKGGLDASLTERGALDRSGRPSGTTTPSGKRSLEATVSAPKRRRTR